MSIVVIKISQKVGMLFTAESGIWPTFMASGDFSNQRTSKLHHDLELQKHIHWMQKMTKIFLKKKEALDINALF